MTDPVKDAVNADLAKAEILLNADIAQTKVKAESLWARVWPMAAALALGFIIGLVT